uniref:Serpin domain-containing protein n=1 Tax=Oryza punctata TaxID=4537 RepID=A0A0E0K1J0_ORYPU
MASPSGACNGGGAPVCRVARPMHGGSGGCGGGHSAEPSGRRRSHQAAVARGHVAQSLHLTKQLAGSSAGKTSSNLIFSPLSVYSALTVVTTGAQGSTLTELLGKGTRETLAKNTGDMAHTLSARHTAGRAAHHAHEQPLVATVTSTLLRMMGAWCLRCRRRTCCHNTRCASSSRRAQHLWSLEKRMAADGSEGFLPKHMLEHMDKAETGVVMVAAEEARGLQGFGVEEGVRAVRGRGRNGWLQLGLWAPSLCAVGKEEGRRGEGEGEDQMR